MARSNARAALFPSRGQKASRRNGFLLGSASGVESSAVPQDEILPGKFKGLAATQPFRYREFSSPGRPVSFCCDLSV